MLSNKFELLCNDKTISKTRIDIQVCEADQKQLRWREDGERCEDEICEVIVEAEMKYSESNKIVKSKYQMQWSELRFYQTVEFQWYSNKKKLINKVT